MTEVFLSAFYAALFLYLIPRMPLFRDASVKVGAFQFLFIVKLLAATALYLIYTFYYPQREYADIFRYFDDSAIISQVLTTHPWDFFRMLTGFNAGDPALSQYYDAMRNWYNTDLAFNDSRTMIRLCAFLKIFSFGTYFPLAVIMSFLSMMGLAGLYRGFDRLLPNRELPLLAGVFLLPSTLLWTSGVIKEAFLMFAVGLFFYQFLLLSHEKVLKSKRILSFLSLTVCLFLIKSYFVFLMLPGILSWLLFRGKKNQALLTIFTHVVYYLLVIFLFPPLITGLPLPELLSGKQFEFISVATIENAKSFIVIPQLDVTYTTLLMNAPAAFFRTVGRPFLFESHNPLMLLAALENFVLNLFTIICIAGITSTLKQRWRGLHWSALFLVVSLAILIGLITPILGSMVRYKVPLLPFMIFVLVALPSTSWVNRKPKWLLK